MPSAQSVQAILAHRFPDAVHRFGWTRGTVPTGVAALDAILPDGGFQRGRLAVWAPGIGASALLRAACLRVVAEGERGAWIDSTHTVTGACWKDGPLLLRPDTSIAGLRAAEELARSGGFALVILDGLDPHATSMVRLSRAANEGGSALVLLSNTTSLASLRLASRPLPDQYVRRRSHLGEPDVVTAVTLRVEARASGWSASTELMIPVWYDAPRLAPDHSYPDRRG